MRPIMKIMFCLISFLLMVSTAQAETINNMDIVTKNDAIIKAIHASDGFIFATPPYWGRKNTKTAFQPFAEYLEKIVGKKVVMIVLKDYASMLSRTKKKEVDIGIYGAALYVETKDRCPDLKYIATSIWKGNGKASYYSYLITRKGSGLLSVENLHGKSFAFGSKESTSGYKYPRAWMAEQGIEPQTYFNSLKFLGSHYKVIDAVLSGEIDSGVVSPGPLSKRQKKYGNVFNRIRKFGPIPGTVIAVAGNLPEETIQKLTSSLLVLPDEVTRTKELEFMGFRILSDAAYNRIREVRKLISTFEE